MWGTDWTRAFAVVNYEQAVEPFLKTDRLSDSERAMLMGGACAKAYGWSPKKLSAFSRFVGVMKVAVRRLCVAAAAVPEP